eukprot:scaffold646398_cov51-Prasinocladus_malaysianus.AAC.1
MEVAKKCTPLKPDSAGKLTRAVALAQSAVKQLLRLPAQPQLIFSDSDKCISCSWTQGPAAPGYSWPKPTQQAGPTPWR